MKSNVLACCLLPVLTVLVPVLAFAEEPLLTRSTTIGQPAREVATASAPAGPEAVRNVGTVPDPLARVVDDYRIGPSDLIEISVFQVPELSKTVRIGTRGTLSLPLIGQIQAGGLTSHELETAIARKLQESYLQDPQVSVFIKEFISQRVTVEGNVNKTGVFPISGKTTLLQAIAMAGGLDKLANDEDIKVFRDNKDGTREILAYDLEPIRKGEVPDPVLSTNDIVIVGKSAGRSALKDVTDTLRDISIFGLFF
jgi:polysaccharide biosynthesis/export protein